jgi:hypothetical protein
MAALHARIKKPTEPVIVISWTVGVSVPLRVGRGRGTEVGVAVAWLGGSVGGSTKVLVGIDEG